MGAGAALETDGRRGQDVHVRLIDVYAKIAALAATLVVFLCQTTETQQAGEKLTPAQAGDGLAWCDLGPFVEGRAWTDGATPFDRLPLRAEKLVRPAVWELSHQTSGLRVRFATDASEISARWTLLLDRIGLDHMPATGVSGLDLYARRKGAWEWVGLARPQNAGENQQRIIIRIPEGMHEYLLYLPLYNGVEKLEIGVNENAMVTPLSPERAKPVVFYGTSITQGASASRPGMSYAAILGRRLERPIVNLGFSSNGTMDMEIAELLRSVDAAAFVIDCVANMTSETITERTRPFVTLLREAHPKTPIVLVEAAEQRNAWFLPHIEKGINDGNAALRREFEELKASGVKRVYYVRKQKLPEPIGDSAVDGIHTNDYGFMLHADALEPVLRRVLR